jgi:hypothetical protein
MFDFINNRKDSGRNSSVPRPGLYCVWIRAREGEDAPLIQVWIDPSMAAFDSQAPVHKPDRAGAQAEDQTVFPRGGNS